MRRATVTVLIALLGSFAFAILGCQNRPQVTVGASASVNGGTTPGGAADVDGDPAPADPTEPSQVASEVADQLDGAGRDIYVEYVDDIEYGEDFYRGYRVEFRVGGSPVRIRMVVPDIASLKKNVDFYGEPFYGLPHATRVSPSHLSAILNSYASGTGHLEALGVAPLDEVFGDQFPDGKYRFGSQVWPTRECFTVAWRTLDQDYEVEPMSFGLTDNYVVHLDPRSGDAKFIGPYAPDAWSCLPPSRSEMESARRDLIGYIRSKWGDRVVLRSFETSLVQEETDLPTSSWFEYKYLALMGVRGTDATFFVALSKDFTQSSIADNYNMSNTLSDDEVALLRAYARLTPVPAGVWNREDPQTWSVTPIAFGPDRMVDIDVEATYLFTRLPDGAFKFVQSR